MRYAFSLLTLFCLVAIHVHAGDQADFESSYFYPSVGGLVTHRHLPFKRTYLYGLQLGYDANEPLSAELGLWYSRARSRYNDSTTLVQCSFDILFHHTRWETHDPYLLLGWVALCSDTKIFNSYDESQGYRLSKSAYTATGIRLGGGMFYHLSDSFSLRAGLCLTIASGNSGAAASVFTTANAGATWTF